MSPLQGRRQGLHTGAEQRSVRKSGVCLSLRLHSSSFSWLIFRALQANTKKDLLWSLWVER